MIPTLLLLGAFAWTVACIGAGVQIGLYARLRERPRPRPKAVRRTPHTDVAPLHPVPAAPRAFQAPSVPPPWPPVSKGVRGIPMPPPPAMMLRAEPEPDPTRMDLIRPLTEWDTGRIAASPEAARRARDGWAS